MRHNLIWASVLVPILFSIFVTLTAQSANADLVFSFDTTPGALDDGGVGDSETVTVGADSVTLTTVGFSVPEFDAIPNFTGTFNGNAESNLTNTEGRLGINNLNITNDPFGALTGAPGDESAAINNDESWTFSFNQDVTFDLIDFDSLGGSETATVAIAGGGTFTFANGMSGDVFNDPFTGAVIPAGTNITLTGGGGADTAFTLTEFDVRLVAVPEPTSIALLGLAGLGLATRRRR